MKAAVFYGKNDIRIEERPYPELRDDGVIIKVKSSGICGSDLHMYSRGGMGGGNGLIMGHEFSGDIVEYGKEVKDVKEGDRVVAIGGIGCGECYWCQQGQYIRCSRLSFLGYGVQGAFAEYVSIPQFKIGQYGEKLPGSLSYQVGATAEPLSVAYYAVQQVQPEPDDNVVVIGLGIIGICVIPILRSMGVKRIIACGRRSKRLEIAKQCGAEVVVDAAKEDVMPVVEKTFGTRKADIVFEIAGTPETFQQSLQMVHRGGKISLVGLYMEPVTWNPSAIVGSDISLIGCGLRWDLPGAIGLLAGGKVDTTPMITHEFPLDKTREAFDTQLTSQDAIKVLVNP